MKTLSFETGVVTFRVNDTAEISFNPTDASFAERLYSAFDSLDKRQEAYREETTRAADDGRKIFELGRIQDTEMRKLIDSVFEQPVCSAIFGGMNVYALAGGLPVWCNFLLAVIEEMDSTFAREQKATNPRIAKYMAKYKAKKSK